MIAGIAAARVPLPALLLLILIVVSFWVIERKQADLQDAYIWRVTSLEEELRDVSSAPRIVESVELGANRGSANRLSKWFHGAIDRGNNLFYVTTILFIILASIIGKSCHQPPDAKSADKAENAKRSEDVSTTRPKPSTKRSKKRQLLGP